MDPQGNWAGESEGVRFERTENLLQRQPFDDIDPVGQLGCLGDQFQITHILADGPTELMTEQQSGKRLCRVLPAFRQSLETDVLREKYRSEFVTMLQ